MKSFAVGEGRVRHHVVDKLLMMKHADAENLRKEMNPPSSHGKLDKD
jgi:hypothetical protein